MSDEWDELEAVMKGEKRADIPDADATDTSFPRISGSNPRFIIEDDPHDWAPTGATGARIIKDLVLKHTLPPFARELASIGEAISSLTASSVKGMAVSLRSEVDGITPEYVDALAEALTSAEQMVKMAKDFQKKVKADAVAFTSDGVETTMLLGKQYKVEISTPTSVTYDQAALNALFPESEPLPKPIKRKLSVDLKGSIDVEVAAKLAMAAVEKPMPPKVSVSLIGGKEAVAASDEGPEEAWL